jgi:hypothetical protein
MSDRTRWCVAVILSVAIGLVLPPLASLPPWAVTVVLCSGAFGWCYVGYRMGITEGIRRERRKSEGGAIR